MTPLLLFLLAIAAVYVGTIETAFSALMRLSLRLMAERGGRDDRLGFYLEDPIQLFVPARLLLGIIFSLATTFIAILTGAAGLQSIGMLMLFVAIFILVCEHVAADAHRPPQPGARARDSPAPVRFRGAVDPPADGRPRAADCCRGPPRARGGHERQRGAGGTRERRGVAYLETAADQGLIEGDERRLLQSIVDFGDTLVREVMTPRPDMVAIRADATLDELRAFFREQEYSRIPVYKENLDNIVGIVFVKDLIRLTDDESGNMRLQQDLGRLIRPATFVPETKRVPEMLKEFQRKQVQIAIVVDEYGGTAGLVTIEDLLEEIVGEIRDEYDVETEPIVDEGDGSVVFSAKVNIAEVRERLGVEIEPEGFETVGGYVLTRVGRVPAVGETFELDGLQVEVLEAERRRIHKVRVRLAPSRRAGARLRCTSIARAPMPRSGYASLIGRPNAGKSTLLNRIIGTKVAIVSDKPQTTRNRILAVKNYEGGQIVFVDTPGIHRPLHRLNVRMVDAAVETLREVDVVALDIRCVDEAGARRRVRLEPVEGSQDAGRARAEQDRPGREDPAAAADGAGAEVARVRGHRAGVGSHR